jgi:hypothetical protein
MAISASPANWLYQHFLDGSYFNNFGLDDPAPGGQTNAEPVPWTPSKGAGAVAPFDIRQGAHGANINIVTKMANESARLRSRAMSLGNTVQTVVANPDLNPSSPLR